MNKTDALIIGAGPTGLFTAHQLKLIGLDCEIVDNLDKIGGQCIELYPDKPIYDIPAVPECTGEQLTTRLLEQIKPFKTEIFLNERVDEVHQDKEENWILDKFSYRLLDQEKINDHIKDVGLEELSTEINKILKGQQVGRVRLKN